MTPKHDAAVDRGFAGRVAGFVKCDESQYAVSGSLYDFPAGAR